MRRLLLLALLAAALPLVAGATTIQLQDLPTVVSEAEQVLEGRVLAKRSERQGSLIVTLYQVQVSDWLKPGRAGRPPIVTVMQPGGTVGDETMTVVGAPHFEPGDELILFTRDYSGTGRQQPVNLSQGALRVAAEAGAARRRVPDAEGFPGGAPRDLDELKARIRTLAAGRTP